MKSIVFCLQLKISFGMSANGANFRGFLADNDVSAVAALPDGVLVLGEDDLALYVFEEL